jgi:SAM-dependent methyltransferase
VVTAARLLGHVAASRATVKLANKSLPANVSCPCCGWRGRRFYDYIEVGYTVPNAMCPQCDSHSRHRGLYLWASREFRLADKSGLALVFAPERALAPLWAEAPRLKVCRVDVEAARGVDLIADIQNLPVASDSVDLIWCHHVLEHVEHDGAAIKELSRVLRPQTGDLVVSVPMEPGTTTDEYGAPDPMLSGHWRMYGDDFADRLAAAGLSVQALELDLSAADRRRYAIEPERFYLCRKESGPA